VSNIDYAVLLLYLVGTLAISLVVSSRNKSSDDMFAAGGQCPWWAAGLSSFMTMFSAGTFVVWGGIAYKYGAVAIAINLCYGVAALLAGYTLAGRWNSLGIRTPAEFIELRFGRMVLHFYLASKMTFKVFGTAIAIYALSVILTETMPLADGNPLRDPYTGNLSLPVTIMVLGGLVVLYTVVGGLWGVLMTDVLQFIVLNLAVLAVVPLVFSRAGGVRAVADSVPEGFFSPTGGGYTWWFLAGWVAIHYFTVGAEWAFVQRFLCVSSPQQARKGAYLFGVLYLVSPFIWFAPPLAYRAISPIPAEGLTPALFAELNAAELAALPVGAVTLAQNGDFSRLSDDEVATLRSAAVNAVGERAYVRVCAEVLPIGMMGMMMAAMFSATASTVSGHLNVLAGVLTNDVYASIRRSRGLPASEVQLVRAGRVFTVLIGSAIVVIALAIPKMGGAETVIVSITSFMTAPLLAPVLWGLWNRRIGTAAVWVTAAFSAVAAIVVKFSLKPEVELLQPLSQWVVANERTAEILFGVVVPVAILFIVQMFSRDVSEGSRRVESLTPMERTAPDSALNRELASIVGWSLASTAVIVGTLIFANDENQVMLAGFAAALGILSAIVLRSTASSRTVTGEASHVEA
jgi:SSS family solute:Na+ symporter